MTAGRHEEATQVRMHKPLLLFDVEGTLVDCVQEMLLCWQRTFRRFGFEFSIVTLHGHSGRDPHDMINLLLPKEDAERLSEPLKEENGKLYREECLPRVKAFPEVKALFEQPEIAVCGRGLVTSCAKDELDHYLNLTGISNSVDFIVCGEEVERQKPHPDLINLALKRAGYDALDAIMIGDTPFDAQAAKAAGVPSIGVLCGGFSIEELQDAGCRLVYRDPAHLRRQIAEWTERTFNRAAR
jgi:phosphoglycolate phosphatase-like HAD superfamily hydrolase